MILYLTIISLAVAAIATVLWLVTGASFFPALGMTALAALVAIVVDGFTAAAFRLLPAKWIKTDAKAYVVSGKEKKFYEKLKIRKWKDRVPEIGHFTGFRKNKIAEPNNPEYLDRFLLEICYGELGHFANLFTSFLILLLFPIYEYWLPISIAVAIVAGLMNMPSFMILRYNSYKLRILRDSLLKKQRRAKEKLEEGN